MRAETTTRAGSRRIAPIDISVNDQERERAFRRARRHTVLVKGLKLLLPSIAIVCLGYYGATLAVRSALKNSNVTAGKVTIDPTNLTMADPRYSGFGKDGSEYKVHAKSAVTDLRMSAPIKLDKIDGELIQPSGVVTRLNATWGTYDQKKDLLELFERIDVKGTNGMTAWLTRATVFAKEGRVVSSEPVKAETETGRIRANSMTLFTKVRRAQFREAVQVTLKPTAPAKSTSGNETSARKRDAQAFGIDTTSKEPVVVTSRQLDVDDNAKTALFREDVVARQGEATLAAPELDVLYAGRAGLGDGKAPPDKAGDGSQATKLKSIHARGGVLMNNKADRAESTTLDYDAESERIVLGGNVVMTQAPERRVTADTAVLEQKNDTALLTGSVVVTQGRNVLRGEWLAIDRKGGTARLASPASADRAAGRISMLLYQNQSDKPSSAKSKAASTEDKAGAFGALGANFKTDPNAPILVDSRVLDIDDHKHVAIYTGEVVANQGTFVVKTEELTAFYQGNTGLSGALAEPSANAEPAKSQLKRIEARRGVVVTGSEGQKASGEWADFDVAANTIVMGGGNVVVTQGKQVVRAPPGMRLLIDLGSGVTRFEPDPAAAARAGPQVSGAFATTVEPSGPGSGRPECPRGAVCKSGRLEAVFYPNQIKEQAGKHGAKDGAGKEGRATTGPTGSAWSSTTRPIGAP